MEPFDFLRTALHQPELRWILVDCVPNALTGALQNFVADCLGETPEWWLMEDAIQPEVRNGFLESASGWVLLDAFEAQDKRALRRNLKSFLKNCKKTRFVVVGEGNLEDLDLPHYLGQSAYFSLEDQVQYRKDDTALLQHARKLIPKYGMDDLILGPKAMLKFEESLNYIRTKEFCAREWGFRKRHSRGHGVTLLFHGESGTGKTMAAEVVSSALQLPLYQVDLSSVVSKWVGETEKNLKAIFRSASGVKGILLFDEGDAIFGQRTKVEGSQDRYSNLEVNYLLQEIEAYDGIVILSTNHENNMDPAFLRRFTYSITFGLPDAQQRLQIWRRNTPVELPLGKSVDFQSLSVFSLTGGNIRNCIRDAAARAACRDVKVVEQVDFLWAIKRELQKHGYSLAREMVGETYWKMVAPEWEYKYAKKSEAPVT